MTPVDRQDQINDVLARLTTYHRNTLTACEAMSLAMDAWASDAAAVVSDEISMRMALTLMVAAARASNNDVAALLQLVHTGTEQ